MPSPNPDPAYHLLRVRVRKGIFARLQDVAVEETEVTGEYTTVSDIVRSAILDWLATHDAEIAFAAGLTHRTGFIPSGAALIPIEAGLLLDPIPDDGEDDG
jgi:Arc/MetJ-type ribon-helix-helix transcriptional regulator